jgi:hypothetical protein
MVFPLSRIECATVKNQMRLTVSLTRDGVEVSRFTRNDCRKRNVCHADVGASAPDVAGNQVWCTVAWGSVHGHALPRATACEQEEF